MSGKKSNLTPLAMLILLYFGVSLAIRGLDIAEIQLVTTYVQWVSSIISSIKGTAAISETPTAAALVLVISWGFVPVGYLVMVKATTWPAVDCNSYDKARPTWLLLLTMLFIPICLWTLLFHVPDASLGRINRFVFNGIMESHLFLVLYGAAIWLVGASMIYFLTFEAYVFSHKLRNERAEK